MTSFYGTLVPDGSAFFKKARDFLGVPFRPQGRDPLVGLDCVGLTMLVFDIPVQKIPFRYRISQRQCMNAIVEQLGKYFDEVAKVDSVSGDLLLIEVGEGRAHFAVRGAGSHIHAHAGLSRIVESPGMPREATRSFRRH